MILLSINRYLKYLGRSIPDFIIGTSVIIIVLGVISFIAIVGVKKGLKYGIRLLLAEYVLIILCSTVIFRKSKECVRLNLIPFQSYYKFYYGDSVFLLPQIIMNIVIFVPLGLLLRASFPTVKWWELLLIGSVLSLMIELWQLIMHKGYCEFDDVMHNTLGCLIGLLCYNVCRKCNVNIGAGSVVVKDIPDNCVAAGNPAKVIRKLNDA